MKNKRQHKNLENKIIRLEDKIENQRVALNQLNKAYKRALDMNREIPPEFEETFKKKFWDILA